MTLEDYRKLVIAISNFVLCNDCKCFKNGICTRFKSTNVEYDNGKLMCCDADGCTFGVIRKDD